MILCLSDIHLGSPICQAELTLKILEDCEYDKLIICGDLLDSFNIHRLCKTQWKVLSTLRKISKTKECIFIKGNHDKSLETVSALLGFDFKLEHIETIGGKKFYFVHGDRWDYIIQLRPFLTEIASGIYYFLQKIDKTQKFTRKLKKKIKTWRSSADKVMERVANHGKFLDCHVVVFGHTHMPEHKNVNGIECVNLGSQCDLPVTYCNISNKGNIILKSLDKY
jgi:predicted phosphodiesterase